MELASREARRLPEFAAREQGERSGRSVRSTSRAAGERDGWRAWECGGGGGVVTCSRWAARERERGWDHMGGGMASGEAPAKMANGFSGMQNEKPSA